MKVTLVRHGQTEQNYAGNVQGLENNFLNETGQRQCRKLREKLKDEKFDICFMSPLIRTVETAMILIGDRVEMIPDKRLVERDMGQLEGHARSEYDAKKYWDYDLNCSDLDIEPVHSIFDRCSDFINYLKENYGDKNILIVTHASPVRALRHLLLNHELKGDLLDIVIDNCYCETIEV